MEWHCIISPTVPFAYIKGWTFCVMPGLYSSLHVHRPAQMLTGPITLCLGHSFQQELVMAAPAPRTPPLSCWKSMAPAPGGIYFRVEREFRYIQVALFTHR